MLRDFLLSCEETTRRNGSLPRFVVGIRENVSSSLSVSLPSSRIQHFCVVITTILRFEIIFSVLCGTLSVLLSKCLFLFFFESSNVSRFSFNSTPRSRQLPLSSRSFRTRRLTHINLCIQVQERSYG